jgi:hypothetical protein
MGMYNMLFGTNPDAELLLTILKSTGDFDTGRFRDAYLSQDGTEILIYTRNGGGNREDYEEAINSMQNHPCYLRDEDDDFDCTYAYFYFAVPPKYLELTKSLANGVELVSIGDRLKEVSRALLESKGK